MGPIPLPLGELAQISGFGPILAGKLLSIAFSGLRLEAPRKSTGVDSLWLDSGWHPRRLMTTKHILVPPPWVGVKIDESSIYGKFHWTHKSDFFNFSIGVPIHKKKSRDEITIITETGKIPERNDTTCGSPSLSSFIVTKGKNSKNGHFDAPVRD